LPDFGLAAFGIGRHQSGHDNEERRMIIDKIALFAGETVPHYAVTTKKS
jgi:hypothetical protein